METTPVLLLLEDERALRQLLSQALADHGFRVHAAESLESGKRLIDRVGWQTIDVVLTDVNLSRDPAVRDGMAFYHHWRARHPVPPFIFLSGLGEFAFPPGAAPAQSWADPAYHLAKPFQFSTLVTLIHFILAD